MLDIYFEYSEDDADYICTMSMAKYHKFLPELNNMARSNGYDKVSTEKKEYDPFPITDYHDWTHKGTSKEQREKLNIGDVYLNAAECKKCGYFIRSRNKHDMVGCKCGCVTVDGGSWYCKRGGDLHEMINHIEYYDDVEDKETL